MSTAAARSTAYTEVDADVEGDAHIGVDAFVEVDAYIERLMRRLKIPGAALAIVEGDKVVHRRGFGRARPGGETPTARTPFYIGSLTKSFTALAVMQLVEAGKIALDAPVQVYLPWFGVADPQASAQITVRHLLNQTSGISGLAGEVQLADFDGSPEAAKRQAQALSTLVLDRSPGAAFEYSNANYNLLGLIVGAASGRTYEEYLQEHVLTPLEMEHTTRSPATAQENGLAVGHQYWFAMPVAAPDLVFPHGALAGGGLISTAEDMAQYMIAFLHGGRYGDAQILSASGIKELQRGATEATYGGMTFGQYAMGWYEDTIGQTRVLWHSGILPHFFAVMALLPAQKKGFVLLLNACSHWMSPVLTESTMVIPALLAGEQRKPAPFPFERIIPWLLRAQLMIPVLQAAGVAATLGLLRRWRRNPQSRPSACRAWGRHILLPLIPNLLIASSLRPLLGKRRGYLRLFMPDYALLAPVFGSFALLWSVLRSGLLLKALRRQWRIQ